MIIFGVIVLLVYVMTILIVCRRKPRPPGRHTIVPDEGMNSVKDSDGAKAFRNALDHPDNRYYTINDFYNMKSDIYFRIFKPISRQRNIPAAVLPH